MIFKAYHTEAERQIVRNKDSRPYFIPHFYFSFTHFLNFGLRVSVMLHSVTHVTVTSHRIICYKKEYREF